MLKKTTETRTKLQPLPLRLHSRVRVVSVTIQASCSYSLRQSLLKWLNATGTVINFDPRWTHPYIVKLDNGDSFAFAKDSLEVLEP